MPDYLRHARAIVVAFTSQQSIPIGLLRAHPFRLAVYRRIGRRARASRAALGDGASDTSDRGGAG